MRSGCSRSPRSCSEGSGGGRLDAGLTFDEIRTELERGASALVIPLLVSWKFAGIRLCESQQDSVRTQCRNLCEVLTDRIDRAIKIALELDLSVASPPCVKAGFAQDEWHYRAEIGLVVSDDLAKIFVEVRFDSDPA